MDDRLGKQGALKRVVCRIVPKALLLTVLLHKQTAVGQRGWKEVLNMPAYKVCGGGGFFLPAGGVNGGDKEK